MNLYLLINQCILAIKKAESHPQQTTNHQLIKMQLQTLLPKCSQLESQAQMIYTRCSVSREQPSQILKVQCSSNHQDLEYNRSLTMFSLLTLTSKKRWSIKLMNHHQFCKVSFQASRVMTYLEASSCTEKSWIYPILILTMARTTVRHHHLQRQSLDNQTRSCPRLFARHLRVCWWINSLKWRWEQLLQCSLRWLGQGLSTHTLALIQSNNQLCSRVCKSSSRNETDVIELK